MAEPGSDGTVKGARKLGRGLGNLIPVPLPPKTTVSAGDSASRVESAAANAGASTGAIAAPSAVPSAAPSTGAKAVTRTGSGAATITGANAAAVAGSSTSAPAGSTGNMGRASPAPTPPTVKAVPGTGSGPASTAMPAIPPVGAANEQSVYRVVGINRISRNPWQPREMFHEEQIRELAQSIEAAGLMQPLVVRPIKGGFELIAGERRLRALQLLGRTEAPVVVHEVNDQVAAEWALIENLQREDLNPMERASAMQRLVREFSLTHDELADRLGLKRVSVTNLLSLNNLDAKTGALVRSGALSAGHAKCLLSIDAISDRTRLAEQAVKEGWPVRKLEQEAKRLRERSTGNIRLPKTRSVSAHVADLERQLTDHLGTKVTIQLGRKPNTGRLVVQFYSTAQFEGLLQQMNYHTNAL